MEDERHRVYRLHNSDLLKLRDTLEAAVAHHTNRDASNAYLHMASNIRYSPLTSELGAALDRVKAIMDDPAAWS